MNKRYNSQILGQKSYDDNSKAAGFIWDRVNFHNKLVWLTQAANQMGYSIPCDAMLNISVGSWLKESLLLLRSKLSVEW